MEANLTGSPIYASNPDNLAVAEDANSDKTTTAVAKSSNEMEIDFEEEHKREAYKETMNIDIENISKAEKRHKHYTKKWDSIYEVIQQEFFDETDISQISF